VHLDHLPTEGKIDEMPTKSEAKWADGLPLGDHMHLFVSVFCKYVGKSPRPVTLIFKG